MARVIRSESGCKYLVIVGRMIEMLYTRDCGKLKEFAYRRLLNEDFRKCHNEFEDNFEVLP